ncbi:processed acidic surface protein [Planococcus sp. SE5232]|uniref:processed acidic surface protein n=1 Tax=unclassified Planococcus (in: firmicutes) TaxID=2662419 RepID=UPI003D6B7AC8
MKRLALFLLVLAVGVSTMPLSAFAIKADDAQFDRHLTEIDWKKQDYLDYLTGKDWSLEEFESADELGTPLTEAGIQALLGELEMTRTELNELLYEYGDLEYGQDVLEGTYLIFIEDVKFFVEFYLEEYTGTPINAVNLQELMERYGFTSETELEEYLQDYSDSLANYEYIEDLESSLLYYSEMGEYGFDTEFLFTELGLTEEEVEKLIAHLETLDYEDPDFESKLEQLSDRMVAVDNFESADELTAEQLAEILDIYSDMTDLFEIRTDLYFSKDGQKAPVSLATLLTLQSTEGADLLIEIFNLKDVFLADILLTADMFGSELINETGKDLITVENAIATPPAVQKPVAPATQTIKGGKLPATASDFAVNSLLGLALILAGIGLFRRYRAQGI